MTLSEMIRVAERQRWLLSERSLTDPDGHTDDLEKLHSIYLEILATIGDISKKQTEFLDQGCGPVLDRAETVIEKLLEGQVPSGTFVRKSFEAIYVSFPHRESESRGQRSTKNKQYERALMIQKLGCDKAMVLAGVLKMSDWAHTMPALKFKHILKNIPTPQQQCLPTLLETLEAWEKEPPLVDCAAFKTSLTALRASSNSEPALPTAERDRNIRYAFSNVPFDKISCINHGLLDAILQSRQLQMEKQRGDLSSSCVTVFIPDDEQQDGSINAVIQRASGFQMQRDLALTTLTWS